MQDKVEPGKKWKFDKDVAECFDDMLKRSIPQYKVMRKAVFDVACQYQQRLGTFLDIGCSRGEAIAPLLDKFGAQNHYLLLEISDPMLKATKARYQNWLDNGLMEIEKVDLREDYPQRDFCVVLSILTLMFIPIERRQQLVQNIYDSLSPGGALVLVEKVLGANANIDELMVGLYYERKKHKGYTEQDIERKRLSLQGVLVPVTAKWNEELLQMAGFKQIDCFWRWMNFAAWVAVK